MYSQRQQIKTSQNSSYYDDQAHKLHALLQSQNKQQQQTATGEYQWKPVSRYQNINVIYVHPTTGGKVLCGNQSAASNLDELREHGITHIVNCTNGYGEIPNYHEGKLHYYRFPISDFTQHVKMNDDGTSLHKFVDPLFSFVDSAINNGKNVMVHCLAGAHRAGTTSCAVLIHYEKMDVNTAIATAKSRRPIIDPICNFPVFLKRLHQVKIAKSP